MHSLLWLLNKIVQYLSHSQTISEILNILRNWERETQSHSQTISEILSVLRNWEHETLHLNDKLIICFHSYIPTHTHTCTHTHTHTHTHTFIHTVPLAPSNIQLLAVDKTTATLMWTAPTPNIESPLSPIISYQLILSTQQYGLSDREVTVTTNFHKFVDIEEFTEYTCVVAATNGVGQGQFSSPFMFTTIQSGRLMFRFVLLLYSSVWL